MTTETFSVNGVRLFVRRLPGPSGTEPPLVAIHGGPSWDHSYLLPGLRPIACHRTVIAFDLRGCGRSSRDLPIDAYQPEHLVADLVALLDHLGLDHVDLLGFSTGGQVAQLFVRDHPGRVRRLVLASTTAYGDVGDLLTCWDEYERRAAMVSPQPPELDDLQWTEHRAFSGAPTAIWNLDRRAEYETLLSNVLFSGDRLAPWRRGLLRPWRPEDPPAVLRAFGRPVLIVHGEHDMGFPVELASRLHRAVPHSTLAVIPHGATWFSSSAQTTGRGISSRFSPSTRRIDSGPDRVTHHLGVRTAPPPGPEPDGAARSLPQRYRDDLNPP